MRRIGASSVSSPGVLPLLPAHTQSRAVFLEMFDYKLVGEACTRPSKTGPKNDDARSLDRASRNQILTASGVCAVGHRPSYRLETLADLDVGEFARDVRRHVGDADPNAWRETLFLIPPAAALNGCEEAQMLSVRENAHGELPESDNRQEQTQVHDCNNETETMKDIVLRLWDNEVAVLLDSRTLRP